VGGAGLIPSPLHIDHQITGLQGRLESFRINNGADAARNDVDNFIRQANAVFLDVVRQAFRPHEMRPIGLLRPAQPCNRPA
jgi:hypothetical protein